MSVYQQIILNWDLQYFYLISSKLVNQDWNSLK